MNSVLVDPRCSNFVILCLLGVRRALLLLWMQGPDYPKEMKQCTCAVLNLSLCPDAPNCSKGRDQCKGQAF
ncbi:hypothetical protein BC940DRAFT_310523 [Gongronella butleri]|nr:hypothetical protein BC940DRAFT_310523 [Gongronella butleri]